MGSSFGWQFFAGREDVGNGLRNRDDIIGLGGDARQNAIRRRLDFDGRLLGDDDKERVALACLPAFLHKPLDESPRLHDHVHFGHDDFGWHGYFPSFASARAAATISSTWGTAARSRFRL